MGTMTITQEQLEAACYNATDLEDVDDIIKATLITLGITIAPAEPPDAMVRLAWTFVEGLPRTVEMTPDERQFAKRAALAALKHAVDVVNTARRDCGPGASSADVRRHILTALGAA